jgi:ATP-dependent DNA helicase DinG
VDKDLPALCRAVRAAGLEPPTYALLKGRSNFLCQARHDNVLADGASLAEADAHEALYAWRLQTTTGDVEELPIPTPRFWPDVAADSDDCHRKSCEYGQECFYYRSKESAGRAQILVVNHALLWANLASGGAVFDMSDRHLILDEAHNVERSMMDAFGVELTRHRVRYNLRAVGRRTVDLETYLDSARANADDFFDELGTWNELHSWDDAPPSLGPLMKDLDTIYNRVAHNPAEAVNKLTGMLEKLRADLGHFYDPPLDSHAYAIQAPTNRGGPRSLKSWLVAPGEVFREHVLERNGSEAATILTSATLAVGRRFDYPKKRLGFESFRGRVQEFSGREIFDYERNALCYVGADLPAPQGRDVEAHTPAVIMRTACLVRTSRGRALVLLATHKALRAFIESGFSTLVDGYPVRYQGQEGTPAQLVGWLKRTPGGVLVGTRSFWEGVDISGENLSLVVIDKTPFPVPTDPLIQKLTDLAEADGGSGFRDVSIPPVQVALQQGAGRLIRTTTDRGIVAILDPRVANRAWGRLILAALPEGVPFSTDIRDVATFFG